MDTIKVKRFCMFAMVILLASSLLGCATQPKYYASLPEVSIQKAELSDIRTFGTTYLDNPYMEPKTLIRGKLNEFYIVKLQFNLKEESRISIIAEMKLNNGSEAARVYDQNGFTTYWEVNNFTEPDNDAPQQRKINNINRSCIPSFSFIQAAGQRVYFLPFIGKNPIPRPSKIYIQVSTGRGDPYTYTYTLE